jgi:hypothetical protein
LITPFGNTTDDITVVDLLLSNRVASGDMPRLCELQFRGIAECFDEWRLCFSRVFSAFLLPMIAGGILLSFILETSERLGILNIFNNDREPFAHA